MLDTPPPAPASRRRCTARRAARRHPRRSLPSPAPPPAPCLAPEAKPPRRSHLAALAGAPCHLAGERRCHRRWFSRRRSNPREPVQNRSVSYGFYCFFSKTLVCFFYKTGFCLGLFILFLSVLFVWKNLYFKKNFPSKLGRPSSQPRPSRARPRAPLVSSRAGLRP